MTEVLDQLDAVHRRVLDTEVDGAEARAVVLSQTYDASADELWDAVTTAERISRWIGGGVTGDLGLGGTYQIEGNASGSVLECEPPRHLRVTWEYGGGVTWVEADLEEVTDGTRLTVQHTAPVDPRWGEYGPGAVGIGWDLMLLGLSMHLSGTAMSPEEAAAWATSEEARQFMTGSSAGWRDADATSGTPEQVAGERADRTLAFYTGG